MSLIPGGGRTSPKKNSRKKGKLTLSSRGRGEESIGAIFSFFSRKKLGGGGGKILVSYFGGRKTFAGLSRGPETKKGLRFLEEEKKKEERKGIFWFHDGKERVSQKGSEEEREEERSYVSCSGKGKREGKKKEKKEEIDSAVFAKIEERKIRDRSGKKGGREGKKGANLHLLAGGRKKRGEGRGPHRRKKGGEGGSWGAFEGEGGGERTSSAIAGEKKRKGKSKGKGMEKIATVENLSEGERGVVWEKRGKEKGEGRLENNNFRLLK